MLDHPLQIAVHAQLAVGEGVAVEPVDEELLAQLRLQQVVLEVLVAFDVLGNYFEPADAKITTDFEKKKENRKRVSNLLVSLKD